MRQASVYLALVPALISLAGSTQGGEQGTVAVLDFTATSGLSQDTADALADLVANAIRSTGEYKVIGKSDLRSMIGFERIKDQIGCDDASCLAKIGGALGVDFIVAGNITKLGAVFLLNLRLINPKRAEVAAGVSRKVRGGDEGLIDAVPQAVSVLFGGGAVVEPVPESRTTPITSASSQAVARIRCPADARLMGAGPPMGTEQWCEIESSSGDQVRHGPAMTWYASGRAESVREYELGRPVGTWTEWTEQGRKKRVVEFGPDGKRWRGWDDSGKLVEDLELPTAVNQNTAGMVRIPTGWFWMGCGLPTSSQPDGGGGAPLTVQEHLPPGGPRPAVQRVVIVVLFLTVLFILALARWCSTPGSRLAASVPALTAMLLSCAGGDYPRRDNTTGQWQCDPDEMPGRWVHLSAYMIDWRPVTEVEYRACMEAGGCVRRTQLKNMLSDAEERPMSYLYWEEASAFCRWAGKRLPTEAEWERAIRGTNGRITRCESPNATRLEKIHWGCRADDELFAHGLQEPSWTVEWTNDWYDASYYGKAPERNPQGPKTGEYHVIRGDRRWISDRYRYSGHSGYTGVRCAYSTSGVPDSVENDPAPF